MAVISDSQSEDTGSNPAVVAMIKFKKEAEMVTIDMMGTGKKIKAQMICADLTARDIAAACDLANPNAVWRWQKGQIMPTIDNLVIIADACGCKVDDLIAVK